jgi:predicted esterase
VQYDINSFHDAFFALYREKKYAETLDLLNENIDVFPEFRDMLLFFKACLESLTGDAEKALVSLEKIIAGGGCVPGKFLDQDPDLNPIRDLERFLNIVSQNEALRKKNMEALASRLTMPAIRHDEADYKIYYLHGNTRNGAREHRVFSDMPSIRETIYFPDAPEQYFYENAYIWNDENAAYRYIMDIIARHTEHKKIVLAGFSRGARTALKIVYERKYAADGVIAYAPANLNDIELWTFLYDTIKVPAEILVGRDDSVYENTLRLYDMMRKGDIPVRLTAIENTGHAYPEDYERYFTEALERIKR